MASSDEILRLKEFANSSYQGQEQLIANHLSALLIMPDQSCVKENKEAIRKLKGHEAQSMVDLLQHMVDFLTKSSSLKVDGKLKSATRWLLLNLSKDSGHLSSSLTLSGIGCNFNGMAYDTGGYSDVYIGQYRGTQVCVKRLRLHTEQSDVVRDIRRDLCREAMTCRQFSHHNLLQVIGIFSRSDEELCIITPLIDPGNLFRYARHDPASFNPLPILRQVLDALIYLHSEDFVHGDIKAVNVLVKHNGHAFLADYGLTTFTNATSGRQTNNGGSVPYMAPELIYPERYELTATIRTKASDIYACAMLFIEAFTLEQTFLNKPEMEICKHILSGKRLPRPQPSQCHGRAYPDAMWTLTKRCWLEPASNRPNAFDVRKELDNIN